MDKKVFMVLEDLNILLSTFLKENIGVFFSKDYNHPYIEINDVNNLHINEMHSILVGNHESRLKIVGKLQKEVNRDDKVGFVSIRLGDEDKYALGATLFLSDPSKNERQVVNLINHFLRENCHKGVCNSRCTKVENYYWTDNAYLREKNWHLFLRGKKYIEKIKINGYTPFLINKNQ
ncbi:hypothetical protein HCJ75_00595 [Listeria welshimeri]|uniref:hypothetical protein n=1 Tax=Listeria welshimeri TaxID=1643 RepID=UPI001624EE72|nr:hypothetical protein [Listeria welshimeri]MBC2006953.1 hypothetical protein [Listeria welshimeri]MBC2025910.1 hypothetical protein [Listeria welshimeri]MBF2472393.1 hypothetical protein [Listeria welshimeri]